MGGELADMRVIGKRQNVQWLRGTLTKQVKARSSKAWIARDDPTFLPTSEDARFVTDALRS